MGAKDVVENNLMVIENQTLSVGEIQRRIFTFRDVPVMLDRDLAIQYKVATKALNQAVKRNARRFPERFMFQLTNKEFEDWKSCDLQCVFKGGDSYKYELQY